MPVRAEEIPARVTTASGGDTQSRRRRERFHPNDCRGRPLKVRRSIHRGDVADPGAKAACDVGDLNTATGFLTVARAVSELSHGHAANGDRFHVKNYPRTKHHRRVSRPRDPYRLHPDGALGWQRRPVPGQPERPQLPTRHSHRPHRETLPLRSLSRCLRRLPRPPANTDHPPRPPTPPRRRGPPNRPRSARPRQPPRHRTLRSHGAWTTRHSARSPTTDRLTNKTRTPVRPPHRRGQSRQPGHQTVKRSRQIRAPTSRNPVSPAANRTVTRRSRRPENAERPLDGNHRKAV
jgi:hypothetical protein